MVVIIITNRPNCFNKKIEASGPKVKRLSESAGIIFGKLNFLTFRGKMSEGKTEGTPIGEPSVWKLFFDNQPSMVEMPRVVSSSTSSRTRTVSRAVKTLTLFSTAHWRMAWPSDNRSWSLTSRVLIT